MVAVEKGKMKGEGRGGEEEIWDRSQRSAVSTSVARAGECRAVPGIKIVTSSFSEQSTTVLCSRRGAGQGREGKGSEGQGRVEQGRAG